MGFTQVKGSVLIEFEAKIKQLEETIKNKIDSIDNEWRPGDIKLWAGLKSQIQIGWQLCNGQGTTSNGIKVPDLRDRMIICSGGDYVIGDKGGSETAYTSSDGSHTHDITIQGHTLTSSEMPSHNHDWKVPASHRAESGDDTGRFPMKDHGDNGHGEWRETTYHAGSGYSHSHNSTSAKNGSHSHKISTLSPYYALALIIKL